MKVYRVVAAVALLVTAVTASAQRNAAALSLVPVDAVTVGVMRLADMRTSPLSSKLFEHTDHVSADGDAARFLAEAGLDVAKDVDVVVVATSPKTTFGTEPDVLVLAEGRFNVERLTKALLARKAVLNDSANGAYFTLPKDQAKADHENGALAFATNSLALMGTEAAVREALGARAKGGTGFVKASSLAQELGRIDANATAWALVDVTRASRFANPPKVRGSHQSADTVSAALKSLSTVALWATDSGDALKLSAVGLSNDGETLQLLEDAVRGALAAMRLAVKDKSPDMVSALRRFDVKRSDDAVSISGTIPADALHKIIAEGKKLPQAHGAPKR